jgi:hypothetical protein
VQQRKLSACRNRDARHHRISPAGHARGDRRHPRASRSPEATLDVLLEAGLGPAPRQAPHAGRPVTFGTTPEFLDHFGLE